MTKELEQAIQEAAEKYFEAYTGGNNNVGTWTKFALIEFATNFYKKQQSLYAGELEEARKEKDRVVELLKYYFIKATWKNGVDRDGRWHKFKTDNNL